MRRFQNPPCWDSRESSVELAGAKARTHHAPAEVFAAAADACLLAYQRVGAVASNEVVTLDLAAARALVLARGNEHATAVLGGARHRPAEERGDRPEPLQPATQHGLGQVLRQPLVPLIVEVRDRLPAGRGVPVLAGQAFVGGDAADRESAREQACRAQ